jgi:hypothetical protein
MGQGSGSVLRRILGAARPEAAPSPIWRLLDQVAIEGQSSAASMGCFSEHLPRQRIAALANRRSTSLWESESFSASLWSSESPSANPADVDVSVERNAMIIRT